MTDLDLLPDAKRIEADIWKNGDVFNGTDWSLLNIVRAFIRRVEAEQVAPSATVDADESIFANELGGESGA